MREYRITDFVPAGAAAPAPAAPVAPALSWTPHEVAAALRVSRATARALMTAGLFGNPHLVSPQRLHVAAARVQAYVAAQGEVRA